MTEVLFWSQVLSDSERTIICTPDMESRVKGYIAARGMSHAFRVHATPVCPEGSIIVLDENAIDAGLRQATARRVRFH